MFKQIPKSNIAFKQFKVHKQWTLTQDDIPIIQASNEAGLFDLNTSNKVGTIYTHPLYNSIKSKYYLSNGNVITQHGIVKNPAMFSVERILTDTIQIIDIPQSQYGEQIKKGSMILVDNTNNVTYVDDGYGKIITEEPSYTLISYDAESMELVFTDNVTTYTVTVSFFDANSGLAVFTIVATTTNYYVTHIDFETNEMRMSEPLIFEGTDITSISTGNIFYDDGLIVMTQASTFSNYTLTYRSTKTIYESEYLISVNSGEFNYSQNQTAIEVTLNSSSSFTTTPITNTTSANTIVIKDVADIRRKAEFYGSTGSVTGSWDDYFENASQDPTGSYLTPFISVIGLYDSDYDMVAVAKLPKAIKNLPDYNLNFIIRIDT